MTGATPILQQRIRPCGSRGVPAFLRVRSASSGCGVADVPEPVLPHRRDPGARARARPLLQAIPRLQPRRLQVTRCRAYTDVRADAPKHGPARREHRPQDDLSWVHREPCRAQRRRELSQGGSQGTLPIYQDCTAGMGSVSKAQLFLFVSFSCMREHVLGCIYPRVISEGSAFNAYCDASLKIKYGSHVNTKWNTIF